MLQLSDASLWEHRPRLLISVLARAKPRMGTEQKCRINKYLNSKRAQEYSISPPTLPEGLKYKRLKTLSTGEDVEQPELTRCLPNLHPLTRSQALVLERTFAVTKRAGQQPCLMGRHN